jgi:hypothetical protein
MSSSDQPYWKFRQYPISENNGAISKWRKKCKKYDDSADLEFETIVNVLSMMKNRHLWGDPEFKQRGLNTQPYKKMVSWPDIGELRFTNAAGSPLRVFGFFRDEEQEFVMLAGADKDNKKYNPADIRDICISRHSEIVKGGTEPIDFEFNDDEDNDDEDEYLAALFR